MHFFFEALWQPPIFVQLARNLSTNVFSHIGTFPEGAQKEIHKFIFFCIVLICTCRFSEVMSKASLLCSCRWFFWTLGVQGVGYFSALHFEKLRKMSVLANQHLFIRNIYYRFVALLPKGCKAYLNTFTLAPFWH